MSYVIFGRKIASEYLALGTYGTVGAVSWYFMSGGSKKPDAIETATSDASKEEAEFIKSFVAQMEAGESKQPAAGH